MPKQPIPVPDGDRFELFQGPCLIHQVSMPQLRLPVQRRSAKWRPIENCIKLFRRRWSPDWPVDIQALPLDHDRPSADL